MARRRDLLSLATKGFAAIGVGYAAYTVIGALTSSSEDAKDAVSFDLDLLSPGKAQTLEFQGKLITLYLRTDEDIARARSADPATFRDPLARNANLSPSAPATDENRSVRWDPRYVTFEASCTADAGVLNFAAAEDGHVWICANCGSRYDTEGRPFSGPAQRNTAIPSYEQAGATVLRFSARRG